MTWQPLNLAAPEYANRPEPPFLCGLVYRGRRHLFSGPPEANKTLVALLLGLELIRQGETFALIDFESGPEATRLMLEELGAGSDEIAKVIYVEADGPPTTDDIDSIAAASLVIIDAIAGAYDVSDLDDEKRKDAERFGRTWIDPCWKADKASLLIDHVVKNRANRGKFAIGSERKAGRADVHLGLEAVVQITRGTHGLVAFTTHKDRPGWLSRPRAAELELHSDPGTHAITWAFRTAIDQTHAADGWRPTVLMQRVSEYLERQSDGVPVTAIYRDVKGKRDYLRDAVAFLVGDGFANEQAGNRGSRLIRSTKPYHEPSPTLPHPSPDTLSAPVPAVPPPLGGDRDSLQTNGDRNGHGHVDPDEIERLAELATELHAAACVQTNCTAPREPGAYYCDRHGGTDEAARLTWLDTTLDTEAEQPA
jgi:hypothetical protein